MGEDMQHFRGEIRVDGTVMNTGSSFRVGNSCMSTLVCDRCLCGERVVTLDFTEDYTKTPGETDEAALYDGEPLF